MTSSAAEIYIGDVSLHVEYRRSTGDTVGRTLAGLKAGELWARRCDQCGIVIFPAGDFCEYCGSRTTGWLRLGETGHVVAATDRSRPTQPGAVTFVLVRLDQSDTAMIHQMVAPGRVSPGTRVRVVWNETRIGSIRDITGFAVHEIEDPS